MVLDFKTFLKEEWVRVVPFAKYQITVGPGLKQMMHLPPQEEVWLHWLTRQMIQKILVISVKMEKGNTLKGVAFIRKTYIEMNHSIWILPRITGFSIQMVSAQGLFSLHKSHMLMFRIIFLFLVIRKVILPQIFKCLYFLLWYCFFKNFLCFIFFRLRLIYF